jgi:hypothetical protein
MQTVYTHTHTNTRVCVLVHSRLWAQILITLAPCVCPSTRLFAPNSVTDVSIVRILLIIVIATPPGLVER